MKNKLLCTLLLAGISLAQAQTTLPPIVPVDDIANDPRVGVSENSPEAIASVEEDDKYSEAFDTSDKFQPEIVPIEHKFNIEVGKSKVLKFKKPPVRVAISNPAIVYLLQISPTEWELIGRYVGATNVYIWTTKNKVVGGEIAVGLSAPSYIANNGTLELVNGNTSELLYLGHPSERIRMINSSQTGGLVTDMPEPCLLPTCK